MRAGLLTLLLVAPLAAGLLPSGAPCEGFVVVPGQGPSCPVEGGYEVLLPDGSRVTTHGPDVAHSASATLVNPPPPAPIACTTVPHEHAFRVVYAYPRDGVDDYAAKAPLIREAILQANGLLRAEAAARDEIADFKVLCKDGEIDVLRFATPTPKTRDSFATIVADLRASGLNGVVTKKWVFYDDPVDCSCSGQATIFADDRPVFDNFNNAPVGWSSHASYAVAYVMDAGTFLHEALHTLGAVQKSAPHGTPSHHCKDGLDVMCSSAETGYDGTACLDRTHIDCGGDDYFMPNAPRGSYLASHWNVGSHLVRFIRFGTELDPPEVTFLVPAANSLHVGCDDAIGPWVPGRRAVAKEGCIRLALEDESGIARVEAWLETQYLGLDTSGSTNPTFRFAFPTPRPNANLRVDVYDMRGNYDSITIRADLIPAR